MNAKISIIIPAYNAVAHLPAAVRSVQSQTRGDWELLVVNDGSTDDTAAFLDNLDDRRIQVIHQPNAGVSAARNAALDMARGEYVTFLDADDVLPPTSLALRASLLDDNPNIDVVHGGVHVTVAGRTLRHYRPDLDRGPMVDRLARLEEGVFFGTIYMLRRSHIRGHRFPVDVTHCEDLIFFLTLAAEADLRYGAVPEVVYEYRVGTTSAMSNLEGIEAGYLEFLRRAATLCEIDAATLGYQRRRVGRILFLSWLRRGRLRRALQALARVAKTEMP